MLDLILVSAVIFIHWQIRSHLSLHKSKANVEIRLKAFQFDVPSTLQTPAAAAQPNIYPGRIWRLEWGDMVDEAVTPPMPGSAGTSPTKKITYSIIGPGIQEKTHYTTDYKTYL